MGFAFIAYACSSSLVVAAKGLVGKVKAGDDGLTSLKVLEQGKAQ